MTTLLVRLVNPDNGNEAHHESRQGQYWIEAYEDGVLKLRVLLGTPEAK